VGSKKPAHDTYDWHAAAPTLLDRYLLHAQQRPHTYPSTHTTPLHGTTLHHTLTPSTRHVSELCKIVFPKYSSQSHQQGRRIVGVQSVNPQPWRFTNNSLSVSMHIPCLFACFYESVSCVYAFFSTCLSTCVASAARFVFSFVFITTFLFSVFFFSIDTFVTVLLMYA